MAHAGPEVSRPFIFARSQQPEGAMGQRWSVTIVHLRISVGPGRFNSPQVQIRGPQPGVVGPPEGATAGTGGEATELGPPDVERQESPPDRVPDQLGLIAQAKLSHQVCPMALDRPHTDG